MFSRVKKLAGLVVSRAGRARWRRRSGAFETLEGRQYLFAPDMYVPIAGGGCMCPACTGALTPTDTVPLESSSGDGAQAGEEAAPAISQLVLVNADNGELIGPFENNTSVDYAHLPANLSVRAFTTGATGSVRFAVDDNPNVQTENYAPYYLQGDRPDGLPNVWRPTNGTHTMKVTAFTGANASGSPGPAMTLTFHVGNAPTTGPTLVSGPTVWFSDSSADAKEAGLDRGTLVVSRTGSTASALTVFYNVSGNATNGTDYNTLSGSMTIPAGSSSASLVVTPKDDTAVEGTENVGITLIAGSSYNVGSPAAATVPIADNDTGGTPSSGKNISDITWNGNAPRSPEPRTEGGSVQVGSKLYAIGGFTATGGTGTFFPLTRSVHVYDMVAKKWTKLASLPGAAAGNHFGVATDGQNIYTVAGQTGHTYGVGTNTVYKYDISENTWTKFYANLPEVRFGGAAFIENGWLHYVGGDKADRETPTTDHWAINLNAPGTNWVRKASMPLSGDHMSHASINGKVYIFGGEHGHHGLTAGDENGYIQHNYTFEYNPANDSWTRKANMPLALSHIEGSTLAINGKAVLIGGLLTGGGNNTTSRVHVYDPATNSWKTLATRYPKRIIGSESGYLNGKIYMTDGYSPDSSDRSQGFEGTVKFV